MRKRNLAIIVINLAVFGSAVATAGQTPQASPPRPATSKVKRAAPAMIAPPLTPIPAIKMVRPPAQPLPSLPPNVPSLESPPASPPVPVSAMPPMTRTMPAEPTQQPPAASEPEQTPRPPQRPRTPRTPAAAPEPPGIQVEPVNVPFARGTLLMVNARSADVTIAGWDEPRVEARATSDEGGEKLEVSVTGQRVLLLPAQAGMHRDLAIEIKVPRYADVETLDDIRGDIAINDIEGSVRIGGGHGDVKVEHVGALRVQRRSGDILAHDVKAEVIAKSGNGDVSIENAGKTVDVAAANGDVSIRTAGGDVTANTAAGDLDIRCVKGAVQTNSASGSITLVGIGGNVEATTASGDVSFSGSIRPDGSYRLRTISGETSMTLPPDTPGFTVTLITYNGSITTDFPIKPDSAIQGPPTNRKITGAYGDGSAKITLDSFSGEVRISKSRTAVSTQCK